MKIKFEDLTCTVTFDGASVNLEPRLFKHLQKLSEKPLKVANSKMLFDIIQLNSRTNAKISKIGLVICKSGKLKMNNLSYSLERSN